MSVPSGPTPPVRTGRLGYLPGLDGLRALAVLAVLLFHGQVGAFRGGHLGVTAFFTLSGFLITSLLLLERAATGRIDLPRFWLRRARRLVPATLLALPLVALVVHNADGPVRGGVLGDAVASATWVANWRFIWHRQSYADLLSVPSPFQHFWSLGVEEQFYLAFPVLLMLLLGSAAGLRRRRLLAGALLLLTAASTYQLIRLNGTGASFGRAYYGTDTRVAELLVGALLAVAMVGPEGLRQVTGRRRRQAVSVAGMVGLAGLSLGVARLDTGSAVLFRGGFLAMAICTAGVIAAAAQPRSLLAAALGWRPLAQLGRISYGVYVFHWPLFLLITTERTGLSGAPLLLMRLVATLIMAAASYRLVERPVRFGRLTLAQGFTGWATGAVAGLTAVAVATGAIGLPTPRPTTVLPGGSAAAGPALRGPAVQPGSGIAVPPTARAGTRTAAGTPPPAGPRSGPGVAARGGRARTVVAKASGGTVPKEFYQSPSGATVPPVPDVPSGALKVAVVGDSIGNNLGIGLRAWARGRTDVAVYNLAVPACPFSRGRQRRLSPDTEFDVDPVCAWWDDPASQRRQALEQFAPDVIVAQDAINEVFDRRREQWGGWRSPGQPQFDTWLNQEYSTVFGQWSSAGATVIVTNAPCGDWTRSFQQVQSPTFRIEALNVGYARLQGVMSADLFGRVCPNGRYSDTVEGIPNARPDGFHFIDAASTALAANWLGPLVLQAGALRKQPLTP